MQEASVIALVRAGNVDAFSDIIERYQSPIQRYLYRLTGDYELAKDLAQDTFLQAYKSILKTNSELSLKAWLYRIATNNVRQYRRRRKVISFIPFTEHFESNTAANAIHSNFMSEKVEIQEALSKVPEEQRTCLVMHLIEGFKYREIAETMQISEDAVRMRVARGKEAFQRLYGGGEV